ncbi:MAG: extracellular solute-binding protein [Chloroflexota bacterium]
MAPLQLTVIGGEWAGAHTEKFLEPYNANATPDTRVQVIAIPWEEYKSELTHIAIHGLGVGVTQVGAPVVNDLIAMDTLRPFPAPELAAMGGEAAFTHAGWNNTNRIADERIWAVPWLVDPRGLLYWRDMLEDAGIDETQAFTTIEQTENSLQRLQAVGYTSPLGLSTGNAFLAGQASCSWVWGSGADFVTPDGKRALFLEPAFLSGLKAYFRLAPYLLRTTEGSVQILDDAVEPFLERKTAILYGSLWAVNSFILDRTSPQYTNLGLALPPGAPYAGGSSLAIWKNAPNAHHAANLVKYLTSHDAQVKYPLMVNHLPARADALLVAPFSENPHLQSFIRLASAARAFPTIKLGGMLEGLYGAAVVRIWSQIAANPRCDIDTLIKRELAILGRRFQGWVS